MPKNSLFCALFNFHWKTEIVKNYKHWQDKSNLVAGKGQQCQKTANGQPLFSILILTSCPDVEVKGSQQKANAQNIRATSYKCNRLNMDWVNPK